MDIAFDRSFESRPGVPVQLTPLVRRIVAPNRGPMTFTGTCTYLVGSREVAIIDPGPQSEAHLAALTAALGNAAVAAIVVTHTHKDHAAAAKALKAATGAKIFGCAPYRPQGLGSGTLGEAAHDVTYAPDAVLREGDVVEMRDVSLVSIETPGHTGNHLAFALPQEDALFTGDHVMAWSTSVIAPPDGSIRLYMESLEKLVGRTDKIYWPGHGGPVREPQPFLRALMHHRQVREEAILARIRAGDRTVFDIVANVYKGLEPALQDAAALLVLAHIDDLAARGIVDVARRDALSRLQIPGSREEAALGE